MATQIPTRIAPRFAGGRWLITPGAMDALGPDDVANALLRHFAGDWGNVDADDAAANEAALLHGARVISSYQSHGSDTRFWIVTEADRSKTTVLLPEEY